MRKFILRGVLAALFLTGAAAAQTQTPAEPPAVEPAPETAPAEAVESAAPLDWAARATAAFLATYKESCAPIAEAAPLEERKPDIYEFKYHSSQSAAEDPDQTVTVYRFACTMHAYNETHVFFMRNNFDELQPLDFARPTIHVDYENENSEGKVLGVKVIGMETNYRLINSEIDPGKNMIASYEKWRGAGDASSIGVWILKDGSFVLSTYGVDASYDGEVNPQAVLDYRAENEVLSETP
jgi:hypothetical protein